MADNSYEVFDDYIILNLTQGKKTVIDKDDFERVINHPYTWRASFYEGNKSYYAVAHKMVNGKRTTQSLHRFIMDNPKNVVDHINHDTLDNRKVNLRVVNRSENSFNRKGANYNSKSGIRGISWDRSNNKWRVRFIIKGKTNELGSYKTIEAKKVANEFLEGRI